MLSDEQLLTEYHEFLIANRRKKTAEIYLFLLKHYIEYLHSIGKTLHTATSIDIQRYITTKSAWSNTAKIMFLAIVKNFYSKHYLTKIPIGISNDELRIRLQRENDVSAIINYPLPHKETIQKDKALSLFEVKTLLEYAKKKSVLEYCLMYTLFYTGCRKSEIMYLNPSIDIIWQENHIIIQAEKSKTHKQRILYFNEHVKQCFIYILKSIGSKTQLILKEETYLNKVFYKYNRIVSRHLNPHQCRHTFATEQLKYIKGKINIDEVMAIKMLLGHAGDTTQIYTHYNTELKGIMLNFHYLQQI